MEQMDSLHDEKFGEQKLQTQQHLFSGGHAVAKNIPKGNQKGQRRNL